MTSPQRSWRTNDLQCLEEGRDQRGVQAVPLVGPVEDDPRHACAFKLFKHELRPFLENAPSLGHLRHLVAVKSRARSHPSTFLARPRGGRPCRQHPTAGFAYLLELWQAEPTRKPG